jgi:CMP-N-acetylneuraminic acid synthetase
MRQHEVLGLILARGGSKGVPRKNMRHVAGRPLLYWTFNAARRSRMLTRTILSTDDAEMAGYARGELIEVPFMRPQELATDSATAIDVTLHAIACLESQEGWTPEYVALLQPTSPLRIAADVDGCIDMAIKRGTNAVLSVVKTCAHPYLMRTMDEHDVLRPFTNSGLFASRKQDLPPVVMPNGAVYVARTSVLKDLKTWHPEGAVGYLMPVERSLDIDTDWDITLADLILGRGNGYNEENTAQ